MSEHHSTPRFSSPVSHGELQQDQAEEDDDLIVASSSDTKLSLPEITDPTQPCIARAPYSKDARYETATLTPVGQHAIAVHCKTEALISAFNMPSRSFVIMKGTITDQQLKRYSKALAVLIVSRGQARKDHPCSRVKSICLMQCRTLPGVSMGACAYCRWVETPSKCDYYTAPVTGPTKVQDRSGASRKGSTVQDTQPRKHGNRVRDATSTLQIQDEELDVPPEFRVIDGYVYQRIGRAVQREPQEEPQDDLE